MPHFNKLVLCATLALFWLAAPATKAFAAAGSNVMDQAVVAEGGIERCAASQQGQALIDCIAGVMSRFSSSVNRGEAPSKAPQIISMTREAAGIRGKPKAEALRILTRLVSVARGLAAKNVNDFGPAYNAVGRVFSRAIAVIERKG